ncbi:tetratricopeptide repeat protein [Salinarimonas chemoclinalis]|uniref:tetratricopeptide repeat protein n=1 Tax=Salinarimonas chemoclinalis TaxID=3241599 RepID=UPI003558077E
MRRLEVERDKRVPGGRAWLVVAGQPAPARLIRISRDVAGAPFLGPDGWSSRRVDLPVGGAVVQDGTLRIPLGPDIVDRIAEDELVRIALPELGIEEEIVWPAIPAAPRSSGHRIVEPTAEARVPPPIDTRPATPPPSVAEPSSAPVPDRSPGTPDDPTPGGSVSGAADQNAVRAADGDRADVERADRRRSDADVPRPPPHRRRRALAAAALLLALGALAIFALVALVPLEAERARVVFTGPAGGPFTPQVHEAGLRRAASVRWLEPHVLREAPLLDTPTADPALDLALAEGPALGWTLAVRPGAEAVLLDTGTHDRSILLVERRLGIEFPVTIPVRFVVEAGPAQIVTDPADGIVFRGPVGGPFVAAEDRVRLSNPAQRSADWEVANAPGWLVVDGAGGRLEPRARAEFVLATAPAAATLQAGTHSGTLAIAEAGGRHTHLVPVRLEITPPRVGLEPDVIAFSGEEGGPFTPLAGEFLVSTDAARVRWRIVEGSGAWVAAAPADGETADAAPARIRVTPSDAAQALPPGTYERRLAVLLDGGATMARTVRLVVRPRPDWALACDGSAGFRFDGDRPDGRPFMDDSAFLDAAALEEGIGACGRVAGASPEDARRTEVQLGRLLAERAVRKARRGDRAGAASDMRRATDLWRSAAQRGSAYAMNLLGAHAGGTFNRAAGYAFVTPDRAQATEWWRRAAERGNVVGQSNYAVELLRGEVVHRDVHRALTLLRAASARGYTRATFVLGEALYYDYPSEVPEDVVTGLRLLQQVACAEPAAMEVIDREIARGRLTQRNRPRC